MKGTQEAKELRAELDRFIRGNQLERKWAWILREGRVGLFLRCPKCGDQTIGGDHELPPTAEHCYIEGPCEQCGNKHLHIRLVMTSPRYKGPHMEGYPDLEFNSDIE